MSEANTSAAPHQVESERGEGAEKTVRWWRLLSTIAALNLALWLGATSR